MLSDSVGNDFIETLSIGWLRAMTCRRDGRHSSRIVKGSNGSWG